MNPAEYEQMGIPPQLSARLARLDSHWPIHDPSLPFFLYRAYAGEHTTQDDSGNVVVNSGTLISACGAVCEIGGIIGDSTDADPPNLLQLTLYMHKLPQPKETHWIGACRVADEMLASYSEAFGTKPTSFLLFHVAVAYLNMNIKYPADILACAREHNAQIDIRTKFQRIWDSMNSAFSVGIALARNHRKEFERIEGIYADETFDPSTTTSKNPQSLTNLHVGSMFSYQDKLHLCRLWADLYRPEAKQYFAEPTYR